MKNKPAFEFQLPVGKLCVYTKRPEFSFIEVNQTHSDINISSDQITNDTNADGIISFTKTHPPLAIKTADCLPIVVLGKKGKAIIHAGWRGVASKIFIKDEILKLEPYYIFIGPSIQKKSFKVTEEFILNFSDGDRYYNDDHFDLHAYTKDHILKVLSQVKIEDCSIDTHGHDDLHSYRYSQTSERNWNILFPDKID